MDDIKFRVLELLNKQGFQEKIPIVNCKSDTQLNNDESLRSSPERDVSNAEKNQANNQNEDISSDMDILASIEDVYFSQSNLDLSRHELLKLSGDLKMEQIENNLHSLQSQLALVSKRVLHMILENQAACQNEFEKMKDIHSSLMSTLKMCQSARVQLNSAQKSFTTASLGILSNYRKRKITIELLQSVNTIKTLLQTEAKLEELLAEEDFSGAISLLLECQQVALTYKHFSCIAAFAGKLQDTLVMTEEQLDVALAKICYKFDTDIYGKLQCAYAQLGKRRIAMDQLHMHYTSAIHSTAFNVVHRFAQHENTSGTKKPYAHLCKQINDNKLIECLVELCQSLWSILRSYNQVVRWHNLNQDKPADNDFEQNISEQYIKQKLDSGLGKLWHDIQSRVALLISNCSVSLFKFDDFLQVLAILHKLVQIGEEFCGSDSAELQTSMKGESSNYFRKYHISRLEELRLFLENEAWTPCPVKNDFSLLHLQEFRNLRYVVQNASFRKCHSRNDSIDRVSSGSSGYFSRYADEGTPFDDYCETDTSLTQEEDILLQEDDHLDYGTEESDEDETAKHSNNKELHRQNSIKKSTVLLTNTTLTVLRYCGRYLQMSRLLRSITSDVIVCLRQLFEYYLYAVCTFFSVDLPDITNGSVLYSIHKLQAVLKRIEENMIYDKNNENNINKVQAPCVSPAVDLSDPELLYGLAERVVGVESLIILATQFDLLRDYLHHLVDNEEDKHALGSFYSQVLSVAPEVRKPVYECVARRVVDTKHILNLMSKVNWEVKDVMCQHSPYVDVLLRELQVFTMRLENVSSIVTVSTNVTNCLWQSISELLAYTFVEGFSNSKKCSNGGRALMQLDFTQFMSKLEIFSGIKPIPKREFVETYVKAYYLPESTLQNWISEHTEYSPKQLLALVNCTCLTNKKTRQKLVSIIEEMERR